MSHSRSDTASASQRSFPAFPASVRAIASQATRWALGVLAVVICALALVLLFLLSLATNNRELYERHYAWLFALNVLVAVFLLAVLLWMAVRLLSRWRQRKFGSRLLLKLAAIFALVGVVPGLLIYVVSYQFVTRSIESWFDVKVEGALEAGVNLASTTLDTIANDMANNVRTSSQQLVSVPAATAGLVLERVREQLGAVDAVLWNSTGSAAIASAGESLLALSPEPPSAQQLRAVRDMVAHHTPRHPAMLVSIEGLDDLADKLLPDGTPPGSNPALAPALQQVRVRVLVMVHNPEVGLLAQPRFLQATLPLPPALVANALAVQQAHREYQELALARQGLLRMYIGTLTLSLFLAVCGAVLLAVLLGNQLARPLLLLAQGVRDVARGDLRPKAVSASRDELGGLTRSFALMTQQLLDARTAVDQGLAEVKAARAQLQSILDSLTTGVLVLDRDWRIFVSNPGAARILRTPVPVGQELDSVPGLAPLAVLVHEQFALFGQGTADATGHERWQQVLEFMPRFADGHTGEGAQAQPPAQAADVPYTKATLVVRGAVLPGVEPPQTSTGTGTGCTTASMADGLRLVVFDDISEIVSAQRSKAWGEVARRVAHEIKNPLTPIQLSAERLGLKLAGKLPPAEQALLHKSVKTIVEQVAAMLRLVNEFRDYARLPPAELKPLDLNALIQDILPLYADDATPVRVQARLDADCPPIAGDAQQLRQVIHNLLQNAQDATAQRHASDPGTAAPTTGGDASSPPLPPVHITTQWLAVARRVRLSVSDSGSGFAPHILQRAFEPYVTTKARGTGLGLAVVKKIADDHGAQVDLGNRIDNGQIQGAQVSLSLPVLTSALATVSATPAATNGGHSPAPPAGI